MPDGPDNEFGSELRKRQTPEFARQQRRRNLGAGALGLGLGLMSLVAGLDAMRTGKWVVYGRAASGASFPGWAVVLIGLFILFISAWVLWRYARKP